MHIIDIPVTIDRRFSLFVRMIGTGEPMISQSLFTHPLFQTIGNVSNSNDSLDCAKDSRNNEKSTSAAPNKHVSVHSSSFSFSLPSYTLVILRILVTCLGGL